jgi:hypothetical protein
MLPTVSAAVSQFADIAGYFRVDYELKGRPVQLSNTALHARVAEKLQHDDQAVYLMNFHRIGSAPVMNELAACTDARAKLKAVTIELEQIAASVVVRIAELKAKHQASNGDDTQQQERSDVVQLEAAKQQAERCVTSLNAVITAFDQFVGSLTVVPEGKSHSLLATVAMRQYLDERNISHLLYLAVTSSGGESIVEAKKLFNAGGLAFLGGSAVTYILADVSGEIVAADTLIGMSSVKYHLDQDDPPFFIH